MSVSLPEVISGLEIIKEGVALTPPPVGPLAVAGITFAELIATFIDEAEHQRVIDTINTYIRSGGKEMVQGTLDELYPKGKK